MRERSHGKGHNRYIADRRKTYLLRFPPIYQFCWPYDAIEKGNPLSCQAVFHHFSDLLSDDLKNQNRRMSRSWLVIVIRRALLTPQMLSDRAYMRDEYQPLKTSVLVWLMVSIVAGFLLQTIFLRWFGAGQAFSNLFALSLSGLQAGKVWTLLTYSFLHSPANLLHIVGNLLGLYFLGRELLPVMGDKRFLGFYASAVIAGGLFWAATHWSHGGEVIGASGAVSGLLIVFAFFYPNRQITFLLFFILPVSLKPKYVALGLLGLYLFGFVFYEIMGALSPFGFAHSAHLGGMLIGWLYYRYVHDRKWSFPTGAAGIELPSWAKKKVQSTTPSPRYQVNLGSQGDFRAEVDRILDKINSKGFGALTDDEKRVLDSAKDMFSKK